MKKIHFKLNGRVASLVEPRNRVAVREVFSFAVKSARYNPAHKLWLKQKIEGVPADERDGWNGKDYLMELGDVPVGLLFGATKELAKAGYVAKWDVWKNRPGIPLTKGFTDPDPKYEYQNQCTTAMLDAIGKYGGGLVQAATGTGKTKTAAQFFSWLDCPCLFVVDQVDLLYQSQKEIQDWFKHYGIKKKVGIVGNSKFEPGDVTVATIQTISKFKSKLDFVKWYFSVQCVLIDEIHVQMGRRNFSVIEKMKPTAVFGLTATIQLGQKPVRMKCQAICGPLVFEYKLEEGVQGGVLSPGIAIQIPVAKNPKPLVDKSTPENRYKHEVVFNANVYETTRAIVKACRKEDLCIVVLCERVRHVKRLNKELAAYNPKLFYGAIRVDQRKKQLKDFDRGVDNVIIANKVFTKGINLKRIDVVLDTAQRSNRNDTPQKYGRAARLHTEKAGIYYFDLFTLDEKLEKAAKVRRNSLKKMKVPIKILSMVDVAFGAQAILRVASKMLDKALESTRQGRLFN